MTMGWTSDKVESFAVMDYAVDNGINFFDTADTAVGVLLAMGVVVVLHFCLLRGFSCSDGVDGS